MHPPLRKIPKNCQLFGEKQRDATCGAIADSDVVSPAAPKVGEQDAASGGTDRCASRHIDGG